MYSEKKKEKVLAYLHKMASVTNACKKVGISRRVFYDWKKQDPEFAALCAEMQVPGERLGREDRTADRPHVRRAADTICRYNAA